MHLECLNDYDFICLSKRASMLKEGICHTLDSIGNQKIKKINDSENMKDLGKVKFKY